MRRRGFFRLFAAAPVALALPAVAAPVMAPEVQYVVQTKYYSLYTQHVGEYLAEITRKCFVPRLVEQVNRSSPVLSLLMKNHG